MKFIFKLSAALLVALAVGVGSALVLIERSLQSSPIQKGPWHANMAIGGEAAGPYARAAAARADPFALPKSEVIAFTAVTDDAGARLDSACDYKITGGELPAHEWSLTAYGADHYLIPNPQDRYSFRATEAARGQDGLYTIYLSPTAKPGDRIPSGKKRQNLSVTLRLYDPEPTALASPSTIRLPAIMRETCP